MSLFTEYGPFPFSNDQNPLILDIGKLASFPPFKDDDTLGNALICK